MVGSGLYLGLAQQNWLVLMAGAAFLQLCAAMIASDRPAARRTASDSRASSRRRRASRSVPQPLSLRRDASATQPQLVHKRVGRRAEIIARTLERVGLVGPFAHCTM